MSSLAYTKSAICELHTHHGIPDEDQLATVFSPHARLVVEAPAGCGKTRTMVSRIAYLIASGRVQWPKRTLALTFSVNAAQTMRRELSSILPRVLQSSSEQAVSSVIATNYHGLCRRVLRRYGYLLAEPLGGIDTLLTLDDGNKKELSKLELGQSEEQVLLDVTQYAKGCHNPNEGLNAIAQSLESYSRVLLENVIPKGYISFNGIILLTRFLFSLYPDILLFYHSFFQAIVVDEFQDTNLLQWLLLSDLIGHTGTSARRELNLFGDPLQRIYGFIGAIPHALGRATHEYGMSRLHLGTNHRFLGNPEMLALEKGIRRAIDHRLDGGTDETRIRCLVGDTQLAEAQLVASAVARLVSDPATRVAVLLRSGMRSFNTSAFVGEFVRAAEGCFDCLVALFSEDETEYTRYHDSCVEAARRILREDTPRSLAQFCSMLLHRMAPESSASQNENVLYILLRTLLSEARVDAPNLSAAERIENAIGLLSSRSLRHYLDRTPQRVTLCTVHSAKGLEWDHVFVVDMEKCSFPAYAVCKPCTGQCKKGPPGISTTLADALIEELSVFYVAATRARKSATFSLSVTGVSPYSNPANQASCLLFLPGITAYRAASS